MHGNYNTNHYERSDSITTMATIFVSRSGSMTQCKGRYRLVKYAVISSQLDECAVLFTMLT